jgi:cytosine/adenosine deaminase-related metal-dependent hydrolase
MTQGPSEVRATLLRARVVAPVSQPPLEDGAVLVSDGVIQAVGRWADLDSAARGETVDLGDVIVLPGLINAHAHLDYTGMAGLLPPLKSFPDWIKSILALKSNYAYSDYAESWSRGAQMLVQTGTTTVADIEAVPELLPDLWEATPLRVHSFLEMTGVRSRRMPEAVLAEAADHAERLPVGRCRVGLSPHAPYSTTPHLLRLAAAKAAEKGWRLTIHAAESQEEFAMFTQAQGSMFDWLRRNDRDMADCGGGSPIRQLERCGVLNPALLAVHVNYLAEGDAALLGRHGVSVAHCPRSHAYFGHKRFPLDTLTQAGVNLCLGTDSLATVLKGPRDQVQLDLFAEIRALARAEPGLAPDHILRMATVNGARALGREGELGELREGALADLIAIGWQPSLGGIHEAVVHHPGKVVAAMIGGRWVIPPPPQPG